MTEDAGRTQKGAKASFEEMMQQMLASGGNMGEKSPVIPKEWHGKKATALDRAKIAYLPPRERPE